MTRRPRAQCVICTTPTSGSTLCPDCYTGIRAQLGDLAGPPHTGTGEDGTSLDLFTAMTAVTERTSRTTRPGPSSNVHGSKPAANLDALTAIDTAENLLFPTYRLIVDAHQLPTTTITGRDMATTITTHATWLRRTPHAHTAATHIAQAHQTLLLRVDIASERHYLGPCTAVLLDGTTCTGDVYQLAHHTPTCDICGAWYSRDDRVEWVASMAQDQLATAAELAAALSAWDMTITSALIRKWVERKTLQPAGVDRYGHTTYRFGDARRLALETLKRRRKGTPA